MTELSPRYHPADVEERLYRWWESQGLFHPDAAESPAKKPYTIVIPPPNVTGILHMGHALNNAIQDILIRSKRMQGFNALWVPGTDHAGIATQNVVEKQLKKEGLRRQDLGREKFLERVWAWKEQYGNTIITQLRRLGSSCDWQRVRFTMDEGLSEAVIEVFLRLYDKGLIYRGNYIVNWCPRCQTALADEEAPHKESKGHLWHIRYPLKSGQGEIVVATTRPETMLGDTAVAVHPKDKRYKALIGQQVVLPLVGREIPVVADDMVDRAFGTGAVKITPAHDPNDFQFARRHPEAAVLNVMTGDGKMENVPEPFKGLDRFECRKRVVEALEQQGLLVKVDDHQHAVGHCYRCDTVVEPRLSPQWFVKMKPLAEPAIKAVKSKTITFTPKRWTKVYLNWMENIQDWCISRQIWWGHRLPVYYCDRCAEANKTDELAGVTVSKTRPAACPKCGSTELRQDEDVLDTWFSSWLWPFSTLGWPKQTQDLKTFYPTNTLVTAPEIIFFWVARMIMAGYFCMGREPFTRVYIHGTVRDITGKKMSKSLGNIIDPLEIIKDFGTDALRYTLITTTAVGQDVFLSEDRFTAGRNFANKLWNATRFVLAQCEGEGKVAKKLPKASELSLADRWILSRLNRTITTVTKALDTYAFNEAGHALYDFLWGDVCDWYLEISKVQLAPGSRLQAEGKSLEPPALSLQPLSILVHVLETSFRLLHPIMPFVTEELWQHLRTMTGQSSDTSIMVAPWPKAARKWIDEAAETEFQLFQSVVGAIRNTKAELNVPIQLRPAIQLSVPKPQARELFEAQRPYLQALAQVGEVTIAASVPRARDAATAIIDGVEIVLPLAGVIDVAKERERLQGRLKELEMQLGRSKARLSDANFVDRAPKEIVEQARAQQAQTAETIEQLTRHLNVLETMA